MRKILLTAASIVSVIGASASDALWMRYNTISPKGDMVAFSYKGDIYTVSANGGSAKQITTSPSYEFAPVWSPDGKTIAFATDLNGGFDIYTVNAGGGLVNRVTTHSASEIPLAFTKDGKEILFRAAIQKPVENVQYTSGWISETYSIPVNGGRAKQIVSVPTMNISLDKDGKSFVYENRTGSENEYRKHHVSSVARDIYKYDAASNTHKQLTTNIGEDRNPIYTPDGNIVFLSERDGGSFNVYTAKPESMESVKAITTFKGHPVRFLSQTNDGTLCYNFRGEIYTQKPNGKPEKLSVIINNDMPEGKVLSMNVRNGREVDMTPDGSQIVVTSRGDVFATTSKYSTTKRITSTPEAEQGITISPDGRTIAYASERNGIWNIYTAKIARKEEINFANATLIDEKPLFEKPTVERVMPKFSPDGKELAFIEDRQYIKIINLETKKVRQITDGTKQYYSNGFGGFDYQWSPDGKWLATQIITNGRAPYSDIAIVSAVDGGKFHNITNSGYIDQSPRWVLDGNAIIYTSDIRGMRSHASWGSQNDVFIAFLNQDSHDKFRMSKEDYDLMKEEEKLVAKAKKDDEDKTAKKDDKKDDTKEEKKNDKKSIEIDLENLDQRVICLTPMSSNLGDAILSKDGNTLYFMASFEGNYDLWSVDLKTRASQIMKKGIGYGGLVLDEKGENLYVFGSNNQKINLSSKASTPISINGKMTINTADERKYMFDHVFTEQTKRFYNPNYHGINLVQLKKDYEGFLPHINNNYDFSDLLSEILGELNVSHTGSGYRPMAVENATSIAELGLLYDLKHTGNGLKVAEILKKCPFDTKTTKIKAGNIIERIDGIEIVAGEDYYPILDKKAGIKTLVTIYDPATKERWDEVVKPVSKGAVNASMYQRWIESRAAEVERLSGGRLGYVHIQSMDDGSFRTVYSDILGKYNKYDGIVIDTRFNGGGRLHEDIEILFSGEKYLKQDLRGREYSDMPSRRYNKQSIMITCEANYSNAHGAPWVYKYKKMGSVVGMPVPGTMTSVNWETLQDPTIYFGIPVIGYKTQDGTYLENSQLEPDFKVVNTPEKMDKGIDEQLDFAVKELLKQIDAKPRW